MKIKAVTLVDDFKLVCTPREFFMWPNNIFLAIKEKIYKRSKFLGIPYWKHIETKYFGPYDSYPDVIEALEERAYINSEIQ